MPDRGGRGLARAGFTIGDGDAAASADRVSAPPSSVDHQSAASRDRMAKDGPTIDRDPEDASGRNLGRRAHRMTSLLSGDASVSESAPS